MSGRRASGLLSGVYLAIPLLVLLCVAQLSRSSLSAQGRTQDTLAESSRQLEALRNLDHQAWALEGLVGAFVVAGDPSLLREYEERLVQLRSELEQLRGDVRTPAVAQGLRTALDLIDRWSQEMVGPTIAERRRLGALTQAAGEPAEAPDLDRSLRGQIEGLVRRLNQAFEWNERCRTWMLAIERDLERRLATQRAYLLTGEGAHLQEAASASVSIQSHLDELRRAAPKHAAEIDRLGVLAHAWWERVGQPQIDRRQARAPAPSLGELAPLLAIPGQRATLDALRGVLAGTRASQNAERERLQAELARAAIGNQRRTLLGAGLLSLLGIALAIRSGWLARHASSGGERVSALAQIDRRLEDLALQQETLLSYSEATAGLPALPGGPVPTDSRVEEAGPDVYRSALTALARQQGTLIAAFYAAHDPGGLQCRCAVGIDGEPLDAAAFSPRGLHDDVLEAPQRIVLDGPFELAGECIGMASGSITASCVAGWPIAAHGVRLGALLTAHRARPSERDEACIRATVDLLAARLLEERGRGPRTAPQRASGRTDSTAAVGRARRPRRATGHPFEDTPRTRA